MNKYAVNFLKQLSCTFYLILNNNKIPLFWPLFLSFNNRLEVFVNNLAEPAVLSVYYLDGEIYGYFEPGFIGVDQMEEVGDGLCFDYPPGQELPIGDPTVSFTLSLPTT